MDVLTASVVVLWVLVLVLGIVVFALARQVGILYERVAPAGALMVNQTIKVGDAAPAIAVETLTGTTLTVGEVTNGRGQLLFFLSPDCPICKSLLPVLIGMRKREQQVDIILVSDGGEIDEHRDMVANEGLQAFPYALSEIVGRSYGVGKLPYAVLIDGKGTVVSLGIVNSREHLESLFEAERLGVASIQEYLGTQSESEPLHYDATNQR